MRTSSVAEVRPAPHMDNLVSIYKGMEAAAGVNIFTTQTVPPIKSSDAQLQDNGGKNGDAPKTSIQTCGKSKRSRLSKKNKKELNKNDARPNSGSSRKPSFPAKKRVHVTPYPVTGTPIQPEKIIRSANPSTQSEANQNSNEHKDQATHKQGDPVFSPFFWLRERNNDEDDNDSEKHSTQQTAEPSPFIAVPCFSDIKDSYDEDQMKNTPTSKPDTAGVFDSEMFEWTQRACSPELCSTPLKDQICMDSLDGNQDMEQLQVEGSHEILQSVGAKRKCLKKKRCNAKKQRKNEKGTHENISDEDLQALHVDSIDTAKKSSPDNEDLEKNNRVSRGKKIHKRLYKESSNHHQKSVVSSVKCAVIAEASELPSPIITEVKSQNIRTDTRHASSVLETEIDKAAEKENNATRGKQRTKIQSRRKNMNSSKNDEMMSPDLVPSKIDTEVKFQDEDNQEANANLLVLPCNHGEKNGETSGKRHPKRVKEIQKGGRTKKSRKTDNNDKATVIEGADIMPRTLVSTADNKNCPTTTSFCQEPKSMTINSAKRTGTSLLKTSDAIMKKCGNAPSKIQCAFCQSDSDTEVSGEMMHYFNGKPVTADYNGGLNIIHAHKNCTEWAPDVYFEDEVAINLMAEENYVMLCPLHLSSKLPIEDTEPQKKCRKSTVPREPQGPALNNLCQSTGLKWKWPSGSPYKWVLCCSALTNEEKETVSKFTRLAGVSVSKSWTSTVTHVIASTDENKACRRTLKFLMGIIYGKWILTIDWIKDCMEAMEPVDEAKYEIRADVNGIRDGPQLGRLRASSKQPKLFHSMKFYLTGDFAPSYKGYLQALITAAGGVVLQRKPISRDRERLLDDSHLQVTFIIYNTELSDVHHSIRDLLIAHRQDEAKGLADATGAKVASNTWIIDSIAACKLLEQN
ncbi:hypothetical protein J5N97_008726 [Dioscorea zingiberensis]|uniref:BRCT domain-containing protein n=1 Tax=Dioscorea zingiberensis TaxID=325984 RepID=A0A9D5CVT2_9LILI|nr:hypothetical protein J5N97_008726 [Dioscorea zingiberensis]